MNLLATIYFKSNKVGQRRLLISEILNRLQVKAVASLASSMLTTKCLYMPGSHDFLASIGEVWCISLAEGVKNNELEINICHLLNSNIEYSMNLMRGFLLYFKRANKTQIDANYYSKIYLIFKPKLFEAIEKSQEIKNNLNLKIVSNRR